MQSPVSQPVPAKSIGWALTVLFITAAIVTDALTLTWVNIAGGNWPQPATLLGMGLVFAQMGLAAVACGFSRQHFVFRTLLFLVTAVATGMVGSRAAGRAEIQGSWIVMMLFHGSAVLVAVWCFRAQRWRLRLAGEAEREPISPWQFSLARLFAVTTSAAILLGIVQQLRVEPAFVVEILVVALLLAVLPILISLLILTRCGWFWLIAGGFGATAAVGLLVGSVVRGPPERGPFLALVLLQSLFIFAAVGLVRLAGYSVERADKSPVPGPHR
jgi:hypothetical protein